MPYRRISHAEACLYIILFKLKDVFSMPRIPDHPCAHSGCPALVPRGRKYCAEHAAIHTEDQRPAARRKNALPRGTPDVRGMYEGRQVR